MSEETIQKITEYVYKNYKWLKNKKLIIKEKKNYLKYVKNTDTNL